MRGDFHTHSTLDDGKSSLEEMAAAVERNHDRAFDPLGQETDLTLESLGEHKARAGGEDHLYNPQTIHLLQQAVRWEDYGLFKQYTAMEKAAKAAYESKYGPITQSAAASGDSYRWLNGPWPWNFQQNEVK